MTKPAAADAVTPVRHRSRSASIGNGVVPVAATFATTAARNDGVNLYAAPPVSSEYDTMLKEGREQATLVLENPTRAANRRHGVVFMETVAEGETMLDKFRVQCESPSGFTSDEEAALAKYAGRAFERGSNARIVFIFVSHEHYDKRLFGFEMSRSSWISALLIVLLVALLLLGAYRCHVHYSTALDAPP